MTSKTPQARKDRLARNKAERNKRISAPKADHNPVMAGKIFINYRRDDSASHALAVAQYFETKFGKSNIFIDVDRSRAGLKSSQRYLKFSASFHLN